MHKILFQVRLFRLAGDKKFHKKEDRNKLKKN